MPASEAVARLKEYFCIELCIGLNIAALSATTELKFAAGAWPAAAPREFFAGASHLSDSFRGPCNRRF
jgi:hypothetical protein